MDMESQAAGKKWPLPGLGGRHGGPHLTAPLGVTPTLALPWTSLLTPTQPLHSEFLVLPPPGLLGPAVPLTNALLGSSLPGLSSPRTLRMRVASWGSKGDWAPVWGPQLSVSGPGPFLHPVWAPLKHTSHPGLQEGATSSSLQSWGMGKRWPGCYLAELEVCANVSSAAPCCWVPGDLDFVTSPREKGGL